MNYTQNAIETRYSYHVFRSRLEAKWAAFFDIVGWHWEYEPCDFDGWIPDFVLYGVEQLIYVEVKPINEFPAQIAAKIDRSGCDREVIILGLSPALPIIGYYGVHYIAGWLKEMPTGDWDEAELFAPIKDNRVLRKPVYDFCHSSQSYHGRITDLYDGNRHKGAIDMDCVKACWAEAQAKTQWEKAASKYGAATNTVTGQLGN